MIGLCNLLALREPDEGQRHSLRAALVADDRRVTVLGDWIIAVSPVTGVPRPDLWAHGLFFAEGEAQVGADHPPDEWLDRAASGQLEPLPSDFTYVAVSGGGHDATAVSSVAGVVPLYYWGNGDRVAAGTRLADFVRFGPRERRLDAEATSLALAMSVWPDHRAFLRDVRVLPRGSRLRLAAPFQPSRYWDWRRRESLPRMDFAEAKQKLRTIVVSHLDRALPPSGTLVTVSGGVDSSIVAALTTRALGRRVCTLTSLPIAPASEREWKYLNTLFRWTDGQVDRRFIRCRTRGEQLWMLAAAPKRLTPSGSTLMAEVLDAQRSVRVDAYAGGEFADQWFGAQNLVDDWMSSLRLTHLLRRPALAPLVARHGRAYPRFLWLKTSGRMPITVLSPALELLPPDKLEAHADMVREWQRRLATCPRGAFPLRLERTQYLAAQTWESLGSIGVAPCYPFLGRDVLELALSVDPVENAQVRGSKRLLRAAFAGDVPRINLDRADKGNYPGRSAEVPWQWPVPGELDGVVRPEWQKRPPMRLTETSALHLRGLLNMVEAVRIERSRGSG